MQKTKSDELAPATSSVGAWGLLPSDADDATSPFDVDIGGFDTHSDAGGILTTKLAEVNSALKRCLEVPPGSPLGGRLFDRKDAFAKRTRTTRGSS